MGSQTTTVAVHQPNYLPWIGYFHKIFHSDVFVILDDVEYSPASWIDRNRIKTPDGWTWLTVPTRESDVLIKDVQIATEHGWNTEHWKSFSHNYGGAAHFEEWRPVLEATYDRDWEFLALLDRHLIQEICARLELDSEFVRSTSLDVSATGPERLASLCDAVDGDAYLCGMGADDYMEESVFAERDLDVIYQSFEPPTYEQRFGEFIPRLSFIDACCNLGADGARNLLKDLPRPT